MPDRKQNTFFRHDLMKNQFLTMLTSAVFLAQMSHAVVLWNESSGDLSDDKSAPSPFTLSNGENSVIGTVGAGDQDWLTFNIPDGFQLSSVILSAYSSSDATAFTGVQEGTAFVGNEGTADPYLGYTHFPAGPLGTDHLQPMADSKDAFTPPLPSGDYVFLIQQLGSATSYQFDYNVTPVPEPRTQAAVAALLAGVYFLRRHRLGVAKAE